MSQFPDEEYMSLIARDFNWLRREHRSEYPLSLWPFLSLIQLSGSTFISYSAYSHLPRSSFEFGSQGHVPCFSYGGQLLYLSGPSEEHGLIFVRGDFPSS